MLKRPFLHTALVSLLGLSLIACGGDSSTDRISQPPRDLTEADIPDGQLGIKLPFYTENVDFEIYAQRGSQLIKRIENFSGADLITPIPAQYNQTQLRVVLKPRANARVYDVLQNKLVRFHTPIHSISNSRLVFMGPMQEFIYQRALVLSGQFALEQADPSLIQTKHLTLAQNDVQHSLGGIFNSNFPSIWHETSLSHLRPSTGSAAQSIYEMTYVSLGHLKRWAIKHSDQPSYADFIQNLAVDLRDGYLDGKSFRGDQTPFIATLETTQNLDPAKNDHHSYADQQKSVRENFGNEIKFATLEVALSFAQSQLNPQAYEGLTKYKYITEPNTTNNTINLRTAGAGNYTRAFGFTHDAYCANSDFPCLQGMNADVSNNTYSDIEAMIGVYRGAQCQLQINPLGQVHLTVGDRQYISQVNSDTKDHALRTDKPNQRYIWNVGSGEYPTPFYIQLHVRQSQIERAIAGHSAQPYPTELEEVLDSCQLS